MTRLILRIQQGVSERCGLETRAFAYNAVETQKKLALKGCPSFGDMRR